MQPQDGPARQLRARALVNAAGPWAESFLRHQARSARGEMLASRSLRLIKGSHIVVPRRFEHDHAYVFQNADKRIIFAIPYEQRYTLIGTTDVELHGEPRNARIDAEETRYLCEQASRYFKRAVYPSEVAWSYSGVRPLLDDASGDPSAVTRDYLLEPNTDAAPLLSIWGGKITTFRKLAEEAADQVGRMLGDARTAWTRHAVLPGGDLSEWIGSAQRPDTDFERFVAELRQRSPWMAEPNAAAHGPRLRLAHRAGARALRARHGRRGRARPARSRTRLPAPRRMGDERGRRAVAAQQAGPALQRRRCARTSRSGWAAGTSGSRKAA